MRVERWDESFFGRAAIATDIAVATGIAIAIATGTATATATAGDT